LRYSKKAASAAFFVCAMKYFGLCRAHLQRVPESQPEHAMNRYLALVMLALLAACGEGDKKPGAGAAAGHPARRRRRPKSKC
jgi:hypothetical protein